MRSCSMVEIENYFILKRWNRMFQQHFCLILKIFQILIETISLISTDISLPSPILKY